MRRLAVGIVGSFVAVLAQAGGVDPALPRYQPGAVAVAPSAGYLTPDGAVAVVGYNDMHDILTAVVPVFAAAHPGVRIKLDLPGTRFAPAALARDRSAFAPMGAEFTPPQLADYRAQTGSDPVAFRVAHASLDERALSGPLAIFVHRDNPMASLTLRQIERVYTGEVSRWGELGVPGEWAGREIRSYGLEPGTALALALQQMAMHDRGFGPATTGFPQSRDVVARVASEPLGIGFAAAMRATGPVRAVPIAAGDGADPVALTAENVAAGRYPLDRFLLIYARTPISSLTREFVRLMLSREGQEAVAASPQRYIPLSAREAAAERAKLD